jgi:hypothetical protein
MGAVFALAAGAIEINNALPEAVATGMRFTFAVAAVLIIAAIAVAIRSGAYQLGSPRSPS